MLRTTILALGTALISTTVFAADVAPDDVVFGEDGIVEASVTGLVGDPIAGKLAFVGRKQGNCLACHINSDASGESFHGEGFFYRSFFEAQKTL